MVVRIPGISGRSWELSVSKAEKVGSTPTPGANKRCLMPKTKETVEWPIEQVQYLLVEELVPNPRNARVHSPEQVEQIARSIGEFGFTIPVLADEDGEIVAGHGRRLAAQLIYQRGGTIRLPSGRAIPPGTVPVLVADGWTDEQRRAYTLADNAIALNATWDDDLLRIELGALEVEEFNLDLTGFSKVDLGRLLDDGSPAGGVDPNAAWQGMPEFDQRDKTAFRTLPVHFKDQAAVDAFAKLVGQPITDKTRFLWFPEIEIERYADKRYAAE